MPTPSRTTSSRKKRRILEDSEEDSDNGDSDGSSNVMDRSSSGSKVQNTTANNNKDDSRQSSPLAKGPSSTFRLNNFRLAAGKKKSATNNMSGRTSTKQQSKKLLRSSFSDSLSSSSESEPVAPKPKQKSGNSSQSPTKEVPIELLSSSSSSESEESDNNKASFQSRPKRSPKLSMSQRNRKHGIDSDLGDDSDSDVSVKKPTMGLSIIQTSTTRRKSTTHADNSQQQQQQQQQRKPPRQPQHSSKPNQSKRNSGNDSSSDDESSILRHIDRKCQAIKKNTKSTPPQQLQQQIEHDDDHDNDDDDSFSCSYRNNDLLDATKPASSQSSESTDAMCRQLRRSFDRNSTSVAVNADIINNKHKQHSNNEQEQSSVKPSNNADDVTIRDDNNDTLGEEDNDSLEDPFKDDDNDVDGDSVATEELANQLKQRYGMPISKKNNETAVTTVPVDRISIPTQQPGFNQASSSNIEDEGEFVLPDCDSSSSSCSSNSEGEKEFQEDEPRHQQQQQQQQQQSHITPPIPSVVNKENLTMVNSPHNNTLPANPYKQKVNISHGSTIYSFTTGQCPVNQTESATATTLNHSVNSNSSAAALSPQKSHPFSPYARNNDTAPSMTTVDMPFSAIHPVERQHQQTTTTMSNTRLDPQSLVDEAFFDGTAYPATTYPSSGIHTDTSHTGTTNLYQQQETSRNHRPHQIDGYSMRDLEEEAFFGGPVTGRSKPNVPDVVDLCDDDDDAFNTKMPASTTVVHEGLRVPARSPDFNRRSREFAASVRSPRSNGLAPAEDIDYFSDDNCYSGAVRRVRRVTDISINSSAVPVLNLNATASSANYDDARVSAAQARLPPPPRQSAFAASRPSQWSEQPDQRRRIRNAVARNPFNADSVLPRTSQSQLNQASSSASAARGQVNTNAFIQTNNKNENVYYRQSSAPNNAATFHQQTLRQYANLPQRNDIFGGSGVGAGSYSLQYGRDAEDDIDDEDDDSGRYVPRPSNRGRRKGTAAKSSSRSRRPSSKGGAKGRKTATKKGRGKRGWGKKRGRGGKRAGRGGGGGGWNSRSGGIMEAQEDPLLRHVGGAEITF